MRGPRTPRPTPERLRAFWAWEASHHFLARSESTKKKERGPLNAIRKSKLGVAKEHPRVADTRKGILSKALNWAITESLCAVNFVAGIRDFAFADWSDIIDARGTFVTNLRMRGYATEQVAQMVGWETADVERVAKRYADAERIAEAFLKHLERRDDTN